MQLSESLDLSRLLEHYDPGVSSLLRSLLHSMTLVTSAQSTTTYGYEGEKLLQEFEVYEAIGPITFRYPGFSLFLCYDLSQSQLPVSGSARVKAGFGWVSIYCCGNNFESLQHYWHIHMCLGIREPCSVYNRSRYKEVAGARSAEHTLTHDASRISVRVSTRGRLGRLGTRWENWEQVAPRSSR